MSNRIQGMRSRRPNGIDLLMFATSMATILWITFVR
jgi:hypothetical protein